MNGFLKIARLDFLPRKSDLGLLVLRVWLGASLLVLHGWGKLARFADLSASFRDPLGVGSQASLVLAVIGEVLCPVLVIVGFLGRLGALGSAVTMAVACFLVHDGNLIVRENNGELPFIYLAGFVAILLAGPGRFSIDAASGGRASRGAS